MTNISNKNILKNSKYIIIIYCKSKLFSIKYINSFTVYRSQNYMENLKKLSKSTKDIFPYNSFNNQNIIQSSLKETIKPNSIKNLLLEEGHNTFLAKFFYDKDIKIFKQKDNSFFQTKYSKSFFEAKIKCRVNFNHKLINQKAIETIVLFCINKIKEEMSPFSMFKVASEIAIIDRINSNENYTVIFNNLHQFKDNQLTMYISSDIKENELITICQNLDNELKLFLYENQIIWINFIPTEQNFLYDKKIPNCHFISYRNENVNIFNEDISSYDINFFNISSIKNKIIAILNSYTDENISKGLIKSLIQDLQIVYETKELQYAIIQISNHCKITLKNLIDFKYLIKLTAIKI